MSVKNRGSGQEEKQRRGRAKVKKECYTLRCGRGESETNFTYVALRGHTMRKEQTEIQSVSGGEHWFLSTSLWIALQRGLGLNRNRRTVGLGNRGFLNCDAGVQNLGSGGERSMVAERSELNISIRKVANWEKRRSFTQGCALNAERPKDISWHCEASWQWYVDYALYEQKRSSKEIQGNMKYYVESRMLSFGFI